MRLLVEQLSFQDVEAIEQRMRPGAASALGFLAPAERLREVIARDEAACAVRNIGPEQIADRLETLVGRADRRVSLAQRMDDADTESMVEGFMSDRGDGVSLEGFRLTGRHYRGLQKCPFSDRCEPSRYACADYRLIHLASGRVITFPGLIFHLLRDHHFFEGNVPYRLDPIEAIETLELRPGVDYAPTYATETIWSASDYTPALYHEAIDDRLRAHLLFRPEDAREVFELAPGVRILWNGEKCIAAADREHVLAEPLVIGGVTWPAERLVPGTWTYVVGDETYVV